MDGNVTKIVGKRYVKFTDNKTGELKEGYQVFFIMDTHDDIEGMLASKVWVDAFRMKSLFQQVKALRIDRLLDAEFIYQVIPGRRNQTLIEIRIKDAA